MTSRAAILPFPGDPFLLRYWLEFYDQVWGKEVNHLYIYLNSPIEKPVVNYIKKLCDTRPTITFLYNPSQTDHGLAIDATLDVVKEQYVMLIEDDAFIFKPGYVDRAFQLLESGEKEIVAGKRGSCSLEILEWAKQKWNLSYEGLGDQGPNFWPCYFFSSKELLLKTDRNFCSRGWKRGEVIEPLGVVVNSEIVVGDTFVNTSLQLRAMVPESKIAYMPQYHANPDDIADFEGKRNLFDGRAWWTHIGSLSSGISGALRDDANRSLSRRTIEAPQGNTVLPKEWCQGVPGQYEWERRVQMWLTFYETSDMDEIVEFRELYGQAVHQIISQYELSMPRIRRRQEIYRTIGL